MSIETLLEAAKYVELSLSSEPTRVVEDDGVASKPLPASSSTIRFSTEQKKTAHSISLPKNSISKHMKGQKVTEKKKGDITSTQKSDVDFYEIRFSSPENQSNSDAPTGDLPDKKRQPGAVTREVHNKLEKNRRAHLKECFENLRHQIPNMQDHRVSNLSVLRGAFRFVQILKRKEKELECELDRLLRHKLEVKFRLTKMKGHAGPVVTSDKVRSDSSVMKSPVKKKVKKEKKRKAKKRHHEEHDYGMDDGASTSTASEAEEEERRSKVHSPVSSSHSIKGKKSRGRSLKKQKQGAQLQALLTSAPRPTTHPSVIQSTGQPKQQLNLITLPVQQHATYLPNAVAPNGHSVITKNLDPTAIDVSQSGLVSGLRPTVGQLLSTSGNAGNVSLNNSISSGIHIVHTGNTAGKQQASILMPQPKVTMLPISTSQPNSSNGSIAPVGTKRNGNQMPTMLASALTGHLTHSIVDSKKPANESLGQTTTTSTLTMTQPVITSMPTESVLNANIVKPTTQVQPPYTQIPLNPMITQVFLTQPSVATYTFSRQMPFDPKLLRQAVTPVSATYSSNSTSPVTVMTSQKTIVSPKSASSAVSVTTNASAKDIRTEQPLSGLTTVFVPTTQSVSVPRMFPTAYFHAVRPVAHTLPLQQSVIRTNGTGGTTLKSMYIPRFRTIGSVISNQRPLGVGVGPKLVNQANNGNTATIIVQPTFVSTVEKPKH